MAQARKRKVAKSAKERRKPDDLRKEESIRIRVSEGQKQILTDAATRAGLGVSSWLLMLGLREASAHEGSS